MLLTLSMAVMRAPLTSRSSAGALMLLSPVMVKAVCRYCCLVSSRFASSRRASERNFGHGSISEKVRAAEGTFLDLLLPRLSHVSNNGKG